METVIIRVEDKQDVRKLKQMSADNGWQIRSSGDMPRWLIDNAPQDVPLTDDDIMDEIRQVRQDINENHTGFNLYGIAVGATLIPNVVNLRRGRICFERELHELHKFI